jgi:DnaJ-domain-containing protein 1
VQETHVAELFQIGETPMFSNSSKSVEISLRMLDGATLRGTLLLGASAGIEGVLSKETPFVEFVSKDGQRKFISKHQIAYVEPVEPLKKPVLISPKDPRYVDGFTMLGVNRGCSFEDAKLAYHRLAKLYHPDNFAGMLLPEEVQRYLSSMFQQINTAFTEVRSETQDAA